MIGDIKVKGFKPIHKRWVIECTFSWFHNRRKLCRNYPLCILKYV